MTPIDNESRKERSFEASLEELEAVVEDLESGNLSLDDLISRYEMGMHLIASCQRRLAEAELHVTEIAAETVEVTSER